MNRDEYLAKAKKEALRYLPHDVPSALASMMKAMLEHEEFKGIASQLTPMGLHIAIQLDPEEARRFIVGFR